MTKQFYFTVLAIIVISLSACGPTQTVTTTRPDNNADMVAVAAEQSGDFIAAAGHYISLAENAKKQYQAHYYLRAALAFWQANDIVQASVSLAKVKRDSLSPLQQLDAGILEAEIALTSYQAEQALSALESFNLRDVPSPQNKQLLELRIQAYALTENWLEKANSHIDLASLLSEADRAENQKMLWQTLMSMTSQSLDLFNPGMPPAIESGWFALAYAVKTYNTNPDTLIVALEDWQRNYPYHPADPALYEQSLKVGTRLPQELSHIAILLPGTGPYKSAAAAIKQGIIAAHFNANSRTQLHFYDVSTDQQSGFSNVWQKYQQAISQQASIVIGPLDKKSVQILADSDDLTIPVLALNRLTEQFQKDNLFQFGLAPEDDAIAAANYATQQDFSRAVVISPENSWGNRISTAFNDQWLDNGGILLHHTKYNAKKNDFSETIRPLLGLETSSQRYQSLKQTLASPLEFEPRRRQDIDFVFLVAKPLKARQLLPQLKFHRSGALPVIATSQAFSGKEDSQQDIDLNGLFINDIPWMFTNGASNDPIYNSLKANIPKNFERFLRLHALGADAYQLIPQLNSLSRSADLTFDGATGVLSINQAGQIQRKTRWGQFKQGLLKPLPDLTDK